MFDAFLKALALGAGYNATLVSTGAGILGGAAGAAGVFLLLRKRALVSDAMAHATLPGVGIAFLCAVALGGDGRSLPILLLGSAISAGAGLVAIEWIVRRTRLSEDAATGAVLSVFFGFGVVLLTFIQYLPTGQKAGLQGLLLGSTAGMLYADALLILIGAVLVAVAIMILKRPLTLVAFDAGYAGAIGINTRRADAALMCLVLGIVIVGLKVVGLILIVALLIIPPVAARLWTDRIDGMVVGAALVGSLSAYAGVAWSASVARVPTGAAIVLVCFTVFLISLLISPHRGLLARALQRRALQASVHRRQGLLAMARSEPILDVVTVRVLRRAGLLRADGIATEEGEACARQAALDERRWELARTLHPEASLSPRYLGLEPISHVLPADEIRLIDQRLDATADSGRAREP